MMISNRFTIVKLIMKYFLKLLFYAIRSMNRIGKPHLRLDLPIHVSHTRSISPPAPP